MALLRVVDRDGVEHDVDAKTGLKIMENLRELGILASGDLRLSDEAERLFKEAGRSVASHDAVSHVEPQQLDIERLDVRLDGSPVYLGPSVPKSTL